LDSLLEKAGMPDMRMPEEMTWKSSPSEASCASEAARSGASGLRPLAMPLGRRPGAPWQTRQWCRYSASPRASTSGVTRTGLGPFGARRATERSTTKLASPSSSFQGLAVAETSYRPAASAAAKATRSTPTTASHRQGALRQFIPPPLAGRFEEYPSGGALGEPLFASDSQGTMPCRPRAEKRKL